MRSGIFALVAAMIVGCQQDDQAGSLDRLHKTSENIARTQADEVVKGADIASITDHLYKQARPNVRPENNDKSEEEIDRITRNYLREEYAAALLGNYARLYKKMKAANGNFTNCSEPAYFTVSEGFKAALCIVSERSPETAVKYMADASSGPPEHTLTFVFTPSGDRLELSRMELTLPDDAQFHIGGL